MVEKIWFWKNGNYFLFYMMDSMDDVQFWQIKRKK